MIKEIYIQDGDDVIMVNSYDMDDVIKWANGDYIPD